MFAKYKNTIFDDGFRAIERNEVKIGTKPMKMMIVLIESPSYIMWKEEKNTKRNN